MGKGFHFVVENSNANRIGIGGDEAFGGKCLGEVEKKFNFTSC